MDKPTLSSSPDGDRSSRIRTDVCTVGGGEMNRDLITEADVVRTLVEGTYTLQAPLRGVPVRRGHRAQRWPVPARRRASNRPGVAP